MEGRKKDRSPCVLSVTDEELERTQLIPQETHILYFNLKSETLSSVDFVGGNEWENCGEWQALSSSSIAWRLQGPWLH